MYRKDEIICDFTKLSFINDMKMIY